MGSCHHNGLILDVPAGAKKIVLAGNPNAGKSVFFNYLTGMYVDVSNYPGTTLEISHGKLGNDVVIDTPGVYGISSFNDEEMAARDVILTADLVINVINALHLERDLFLTQQIIDTGVPVIVALNMIDEAERIGLVIDVDILSEMLGVPVIATAAVKNIGLDQVKENLFNARPGNVLPGIKEHLAAMLPQVHNQGEALLILEGDPIIAERHGLKPGTLRETIYLERRRRVNEIEEKAVKVAGRENTIAATLGRWMIRPVTGIPILLLALYLIYKAIGVFVAQTVVEFTEETIMQGYYEPAVSGLISRIVPDGSLLYTFLAGEFGILTMTITYVFGLLLPLVAGFYFFLSLLEDSGYLPRIATLTDRVLTGMGLNGRAIIPLILGFGCVTMATITTRLLGTDREKRIAIFLLGLAIPCSAQLGVIAGMLAALGIHYVILYAAAVISVLVVVGTVLNKVLPGESSDLLIDLPQLRIPRLVNVLQKTFNKSYHFVKEALPLFALGALLITALDVTGALLVLQQWLAPLTVGWLNLPQETATAFVMGVVRRDFGAAGLAGMTLAPLQVVVSLITITLFVPCIASIMMIFKERSKVEAAIMWLGSWVIAFLVGGLVAQGAKLFAPGTEPIPVTLMIILGSVVILLVTKAWTPFSSKDKTVSL